MKLNLGCGRNHLPGYINADIRPGEGVDSVIDAEKPLPFPVASLDEIKALGLLEHLFHWESLMTEAARVLKPGGRFFIRVPYRMDYVAYHVRHFDRHSFDPYLSDWRPRGYDLKKRKHAFGSLEFQEPYFTMDDIWVEHLYPFAWHLANHTLLREMAYRLPLGPAINLHIMLRRNGTWWNDTEGD